jgi:6-phosphogluconolactonase/glucosamine-6-phosphate isomerase/deaminase
VTGEAKADVVREIIVDGVPYPARQVVASARKVTWFLDAAAGAHLD